MCACEFNEKMGVFECVIDFSMYVSIPEQSSKYFIPNFLCCILCFYVEDFETMM